MYQQLSLIVLLVFFFFRLPAQADAADIQEATIAFQKGEAAILAGDYQQAIRHFERVLSLRENFLPAVRLIGRCYDLLRDYSRAADRYQHVIAADSLFSRTLYFQLAEVYYKMGKHELGLHYFEKFEKLQERRAEDFGLYGVSERIDELILVDRLESSKRACQVSLDSVKFINITEIFNLGTNINGPANDYFPFLSNNQANIYFTRQEKNGDEDLYYSEKKEKEWRSAERIRDVNTDQPEGMSTLVRDGRRIYFTACLREDVDGPCDLWEALANGNAITSIKSLDAPINTEKWESQAAVSCDGRTLYFASNRPGGLGGSDIWRSERLPDGRWSEPVNLGEPLNTEADEEAPFISNDGQTLYFSSTGHPGLGEQDLFMSWWDERLQYWSMPINLGPPVNSPHRELGFFLSADGRTGYFASNRPGGQGGMDIYRFELSEKLYGEPITFVEGLVKDSVLLEGIATSVQINGYPLLSTDEDGRFFLCVGADEMLDIQVTADEFRPYHNQFTIPAWDNRHFYTIELLLQPQFSFLEEYDQLALKGGEPGHDLRRQRLLNHSVFFGFDDAKLSPNEEDRLTALVNNIKKEQIFRIEIVGFADDIGANAYNLKLSEERAKQVAVFLVNNKVVIDEIHIQGKGPVADKQPKEENRRVDVRIILVE